MELGQLGRQVVLHSPKAFMQLSFVKAMSAERAIWLPKRELRGNQARKEYFDKERAARRKGDLFITHIIDEGMGPDDDRLR